MSRLIETASLVPIISSDLTAYSPSPSRVTHRLRHPVSSADKAHSNNTMVEEQVIYDPIPPGERDALLGASKRPPKKPFYRARPLWLLPFVVIASVCRGMTVAPRVEVFIQLSCDALHHHWNHTSVPHTTVYETVLARALAVEHTTPPLYVTLPAESAAGALTDADDDADGADDSDDPRQIPSNKCVSDSAVQAGAARLQTIMTTTMGMLSALTTGWWGHFGERHGRTRVLAISTFGLFITDVIFILVSTPNTPFATHGHKLLIISPVIEGLLGGWSTLQAGCLAYVSDRTSDGSRSHIFSKFSGVFFLGSALGPTVGAYFIRHPLSWTRRPPTAHSAANVTSVFWISIAFELVNFFIVALIIPESLSLETRRAARGQGKGKMPASTEDDAEDSVGAEVDDVEHAKGGWLVMRVARGFLAPLAVFLPKDVVGPDGHKRRDWSMTLVALALFGHMLSAGMYQIKYLYAEHVYGWGPERLSYYISFISGARATYLIFGLPFIIATFKPLAKTAKPKAPQPAEPSAPPAALTKGKKPKPTAVQLAREIHFDLLLTRLSLFADICSNALVVLAPSPYASRESPAITRSEMMFGGFTAVSAVGSGAYPAVQSLSLSIMQSRGSDNAQLKGKLFGALSVLQATGSMIIGPMIWGIVFSETVGLYPKTVFAGAAAIYTVALALLCLVREPEQARKRRTPKALHDVEIERGRSRVSKDLRPTVSPSLASGSGWSSGSASSAT